ncbi:MAG: glycosyltransferase family 2 protein [Ardenticatenaceae bacterium]
MISVVICTYNRADLLANALETVCEQTLSASEYEVIVVDNNSSDETASVTHAFAARYPNLRYAFEPQQGLSHARNRGWQEAKGDYVGYIDDDCKVPAGWLAVAKALIERLAPDVFGGPYFAFYKTPKPAWFKDEYASYEPYPNATFIEGLPDALHGGNLFLRRELIKKVGGFNPALGMSGEKMAYGEETALLRQLHATRPNLRLYYEPKLLLYHLVRPEKMSLRWIMYNRFMSGRYNYRVQSGKPSQSGRIRLLLRLTKTLFRFIFSLTIELLFWKRQQYPYVQTYLYENAFWHLYKLGELCEIYQQTTQQRNSKGEIR